MMDVASSVVIGLSAIMSAPADSSGVSPAWTIGSTVATAAATVVLAGFGGVQIWREIKRQDRAERAAAARISAIAFRLQRHIATILSTEPRGSRKPVQSWIVVAVGTDSFQRELESLIGRAHAMMDLIGDADSQLAKAVRRVFVLTLDASQRVQQLANMGDATIENAPAYTDLVNHATADFEECVETLKVGVIEVWLQNEAGALRRAREADSFLNRFDPLFKELSKPDAPAAVTSHPRDRDLRVGQASIGMRMRHALETRLRGNRPEPTSRESGGYRDDESTGSE